LANQFYNRGKFKQVCHLIHNLHKSAPHFEQIPEAYLLMARALFEGFKDTYKASQYLKFIKAKYPDCKQIAEVDVLLAQCGA
jgi:TolA-binding protein